MWISGTDLREEGKFVWMSTGKPFQYNNFGSGQPDNWGNREHCVHLWPNQTNTSEVTWNDWECTQKLSYVCEDKPMRCHCNRSKEEM